MHLSCVTVQQRKLLEYTEQQCVVVVVYDCMKQFRLIVDSGSIPGISTTPYSEGMKWIRHGWNGKWTIQSGAL